jgi:hypothetical protein
VTRQSLRQHAAFVALDSIEGRINIEEITDLLIKVGYIENDPEDYRRLQIEEARRTVRDHRKSKARTNQVQHELANLHEIDEKGHKRYYFRPCGELNAKEAAQHLGYWNGKIEEDKAQFARYYAFHTKRHGRKLQRLLDFPIPVQA